MCGEHGLVDLVSATAVYWPVACGNGGATVEEVGCVIASTKKSVAVEGEGDECLAQVDQELAKRFFASKQQELY